MKLTRRMKMTKTSNEKLPINGIVLVNKPQNLTSNAVLQRVKHMFNAKKAGHTGSLDPLATGMLPLCFGEATKVSQFLLDADKCYEVTGLLGIKTNTGDSTGHPIATVTDFTITDNALNDALTILTGNIFQIPPMFSALKHKGLPLYKLARAGVEIERKPRQVTIHQIQLISFDGRLLKLKVRCSKGTYIRTLIEDIGERLGVGAHVTELHRAYTAGFEGETMFSLEELAEKSQAELIDCLLPIDRAIYTLPIVNLSSEQSTMLFQGKVIIDLKLNQPIVGTVRLYEKNADADAKVTSRTTSFEYENHNIFIGLGEINEDGVLKAKRLVSRVII